MVRVQTHITKQTNEKPHNKLLRVHGICYGATTLWDLSGPQSLTARLTDPSRGAVNVQSALQFCLNGIISKHF